MVDKQQIRFCRLPPGIQAVTLFVKAAFFTKTSRSVTRKFIPEQSIAGQIESGIFRTIAGLRLFNPRKQSHEGFPLVQGQKHIRRVQMFFKFAQTDIISPTFEYKRRYRISKKRSYHREIVFRQLLFQSTSRCTNNNSLARSRLDCRRDQIRQRFSHSRSGFQNRNAALIHITLHHFRKIKLRLAGSKIWNFFGKSSIFAKKFPHAQCIGRACFRGKNGLRRERGEFFMRRNAVFKYLFPSGSFGYSGKMMPYKRIQFFNFRK